MRAVRKPERGEEPVSLKLKHSLVGESWTVYVTIVIIIIIAIRAVTIVTIIVTIAIVIYYCDNDSHVTLSR